MPLRRRSVALTCSGLAAPAWATPSLSQPSVRRCIRIRRVSTGAVTITRRRRPVFSSRTAIGALPISTFNTAGSGHGTRILITRKIVSSFQGIPATA